MKVKSTAVTLAAAMLVFFAAGCKSQEQLKEQKPAKAADAGTISCFDTRSTVNVSGRGVVTMEPDLATVGFTVVAEGKTASDAQQDNVKIMDAVLAVIKAKGIAEDDTETGGLRIQEVYDYDKSPAKLAGYKVYYGVETKVRDMDILGALISEAVAAGATEVSGPEYTLEDDSEAYLRALNLAVASAGAKAEVIAAGLGDGVRLTPLPLSMTENGAASYALRDIPEEKMAMSACNADGGPAAVRTAVPKIEITATVNGVYQITN